MKFSISVIAALLELGLVRGLPQRMQGENDGSTALDQSSVPSGSDDSANPNLFNDNTDISSGRLVSLGDENSVDPYLTATPNVQNYGDNPSGDASASVASIAGDGTETPSDQSGDIASADNPLNLPAADWANDKKTMTQVKSGKLNYAFYKLEGKSVVVSRTRDPEAKPPPLYKDEWKDDFHHDMKEIDCGYAICSSKGAAVPVLFAWTLNDEDHEYVENIPNTFVGFNQALGLQNGPTDIVYTDDDLNKFLDKISA